MKTKKDIGLNQKDIGKEIHYVELKNIALNQTFIFYPKTRRQQKVMRFFTTTVSVVLIIKLKYCHSR